MLKTIGIVCVVLFCALCGSLMAAMLKKRAEALKKTQLFLHMLGERLSYTLCPVDELFTALCTEPLLIPLDFIPACAQKLATRVPFPQAFCESVQESRCALDKRDRALLCEAGSIIGASSAENQLEGLALIKANLAEQICGAQQELEQRGKLYASLGVLTGAALAIVLI